MCGAPIKNPDGTQILCVDCKTSMNDQNVKSCDWDFNKGYDTVNECESGYMIDPDNDRACVACQDTNTDACDSCTV